MKCEALFVLAALARGASAILVASRDESRTCPGGLRQLRTVALPDLQFNLTQDKKADDGHVQPWMPHREKDKYVLKFRVVEMPPSKKPQLGFGPKLMKGYRYLLFDEDRKWGLVGQGCVVEGQVQCKHNPAATDSNATGERKACGTPCEQDVHRPQMNYVRGLLGATGTALAFTRGKSFQQGAAASIGVGAGTSTEWLLTAYNQMTVDAVDIEESVMSAALDCFGMGRAPGSKTRLHTHVEDGIGFLKAQPLGHYDLIHLDVTPVPKHFAESLGLIHERLAPGGVLALNGWTYDTRWSSFVQDIANHFPAAWKTRVGTGNAIVFAAKSKADGGAPFPKNFPKDLSGVPPEAARWFRELHWTNVPATK